MATKIITCINMSFYHILPSNTSVEMFPNNSASSYRTPVNPPYQLDGEWEVAVTGITHSNCINPIANDEVMLTTTTPTTTVEKKKEEKTTTTIILPTAYFQTPEQVCAYITRRIGHRDIEFTYDAHTKRAHLQLKADGLHLQLSTDLCDVLAFDRALFTKKGKYTASGELSLTRRIHYFYIYSNIGELVRVGDTEAPLLAVTAFNSKNQFGEDLHERTFRHPYYVRVKQDTITLIEIAIYDGAGQLVPFHSDAKTTVRLHFRRCL